MNGWVRCAVTSALLWAACSLILLYSASLRVGPLLVILAFLASLAAASAILRYRLGNASANTSLLLQIWNFDLGTQIILAGCVSLCLQAVVRLFCAKHFGGHVESLNFGLICDEHECRKDYAFNVQERALNPTAHFLQGLLSLLLLPMPEPLERRLGPRKKKVCFNAQDSLAPLVSGYPMYNFIKRNLKSGSSFAASPFPKCICEWGAGVVFGLALGFFWRGTGPEPVPRQISAWVRCWRLAAGIAMFIVSVLSAVCYGVTWNVVWLGVGQLKQGGASIVALLCMLACPCFVVIVAVVCRRASIGMASVGNSVCSTGSCVAQ